jgi:hypothetical protein
MLPLRFDRSGSRLRRSSGVPSTVHTAHRVIADPDFFDLLLQLMT